MTTGLVVALSVGLTVATPPMASAADGPSVELPGVPSIPVQQVGQGTRDPKKDEAGQSAKEGNQTSLPSTLPGEGSYTATSLTQSGKWDVAGQTGDFSWSYPLRVPPAAGGLVPALGLGYSSSAVDGLTSATNNQASWVGDGWGLWPGFVERTYGSCATDLPGDPKFNPADLCWKSDNATLSLSGNNTMLIWDEGKKVWKPKNDNGSRVEKLVDPNHRNGDDNGEHWKITTTDGTQYFFGSRTNSGATWTVPVFGDDDKEPCHKPGDFAGSACTQASRWNLDKVVNRNGDVMTYDYGVETNKYGQNKNSKAAEYVRGGWLKSIEYGLRDDTPELAASSRVVFEEVDRCVPGATACDWTKAEHRNNFPDVPLELKCDGTTCEKTWSPSFWTTKRLHKIRTEVRQGDTYNPVDSWELRHQFPSPGDTGKPALWLAGITHTGHDGGDLALPEVTFEGVRKPNRVVKPGDGHAHLIRFRISAIVSESGGVTSVSYAAPNCDAGTKIEPKTNGLRCFPAKWSMPNSAPREDYFHKYVVESVSESDWIGSERSSQTDYEYVGSAAWHYDESEFTLDKDKTYNQFRGYGTVIVRTGVEADATKRTKASTMYYRGMNGDKDKPEPVRVTDSEGGSELDHNWLNGTVRETITYLGNTNQIVSKTITEPYSSEKATATRGPYEARIVRPGVTRNFTMLDGGGKQETKTRNIYKETDPVAAVWRVHDFGDAADTKTDDDRCSTTTYARDTEKWLMDLPSEVDTVAVPCTALATAQFPRDAISNLRTTYDSRGNVTSTKVLKERPAADSFVHVTTSTIKEADIDRHGRALAVADALGRTTRTEYTPATGGPVTQVKTVNALGFPLTTTLNPANGLTVKAVDVNNRVTQSAYDPLGRLTQVWLPGRDKNGDNGNKKFFYKISRTEPNVVRTEQLGPNGTYLTSREILDGQLRPRQTQRKTDEGRLLTDIRYDTHGRAFRKSATFFTSGEPDDKLWVASNSEAIPPHTVTEFDGAGRPTAEIFKAPLEKWRTTTTYGGNWTKVTPPAGGIPTTTLVDARGQVIERRTDAPGGYDATTYAYTAAGQLKETKDPENNVWQSEYDLLGRVVVQHDPDKGRLENTYNDVNELVEVKDARGVVLRTTRDDLGRPKLTEEVRKDTTTVKRAEWTYDTVKFGKGMLASGTRWTGDVAYKSSVVSYDRAGRPGGTQLEIPGIGTFLTTTSYKPDGSPASTGLPAVGTPGTPGYLAAESLSHSYDEFGRLESTYGGPEGTGTFNYVSDTTYTKYGEVQQLQLGGARPDMPAANEAKRSWVTTMYDADTRRPNRTIVDTETPKPMQADVNHTYNPAGLITSIVDEPREGEIDVQCFRYDHLQRLSHAWTPPKTVDSCKADPSADNLAGPAKYLESFKYDKVGNRITSTHNTAEGTTNRTYNKGAGHRLASMSATRPGVAADTVDEPVYDATGNTIQRKTKAGTTQKLDWDADGRLERVTEGDKVTEFVYGAAGERLIRKDPTGTTVYLTGQELRVSGSVKTATRYYAHGGRIVASRSGDRVDYVATDHQGTMNMSINASTPTLNVERRRQLPFGGPRGRQGNFVGDKGFVGGTVDSSAGFVTLGVRQYDADTGRFLSVDPIGDFSDPQQLHGYSYSNNSPISNSDPSGLLRTPCIIDGPCANPRGEVPSPSPKPGLPPPGRNGNSSSLESILGSRIDSRIPDRSTPEQRMAWIWREQAALAYAKSCGPSAPRGPLGTPNQFCSGARKAYEDAVAAYDKAYEPPKRDIGDLMDAIVQEEERLLREGRLRPGGEQGLTFSACGGVEAYVGGGVAGEFCVAKDATGWGYSLTGKVGMAPKLGYGAGLSVKLSEGTIEDLAGRGRWIAAGPMEIGQSADGKVSISGGEGIGREIKNIGMAAGTEWTVSARFNPDAHKNTCSAFGVCQPR